MKSTYKYIKNINFIPLLVNAGERPVLFRIQTRENVWPRGRARGSSEINDGAIHVLKLQNAENKLDPRPGCRRGNLERLILRRVHIKRNRHESHHCEGTTGAYAIF